MKRKSSSIEARVVSRLATLGRPSAYMVFGTLHRTKFWRLSIPNWLDFIYILRSRNLHHLLWQNNDFSRKVERVLPHLVTLWSSLVTRRISKVFFPEMNFSAWATGKGRWGGRDGKEQITDNSKFMRMALKGFANGHIYFFLSSLFIFLFSPFSPLLLLLVHPQPLPPISAQYGCWGASCWAFESHSVCLGKETRFPSLESLDLWPRVTQGGPVVSRAERHTTWQICTLLGGYTAVLLCMSRYILLSTYFAFDAKPMCFAGSWFGWACFGH